MAGHTIRLHADELEYTSEGLRTPEHLALQAGAHNRVVVERPRVAAALPVTLGGFPKDLAFPTPVVLSLFLAPRVRRAFGACLESEATSFLQIYGHAQTEGKLGPNKALSDRRAAVMSALLTGDVAALDAVADEEAWDAAHAQALLRTLGCDPGPIDGRPGSLTEEAVRMFQRAYAEGRFHRRGPPPRDPALEESGELSPPIWAALRDALVAVVSPRILPDRLHPTHPTVGCTEFNLARDHDARPGLSRRVSVVVHDELPAFHDRAPCVTGDHAVCPVDDESPSRCLWYRMHVSDPHESEAVHEHYNLAWLRLPNGRVLLSALTTVPDEEEVTFEVFAADKPVDTTEVPGDASLDSMSHVFRTKPVLGVAQVVWEPPASFEPGLDGRFTTSNGDIAVPVFRVGHERTGTTAHDSWPSHQIAVLFDRDFVKREFAGQKGMKIEIISEAQSYQRMVPTTEALPFDDRHYALRFEGLRPEGTFSIIAHYEQGTRTLLRDVPFDEVDDHGPATEQPPPPIEIPDRPEEQEDPTGPVESPPASERWLL